MTWTQPNLVVLLGALLGFLSGLFGVGGSAIATPVLRLMDVPRMLALGTPLPVTLPTAIVGALTYWRERLVNLRAALWTAAGGVPFVIVGSYLTAHVPGRFLMLLTGGFVMMVAVRLLAKPLASEAETSASPPLPVSPLLFLLVGAGVGFLSGLLANGGGFLLVPAYLLLFRMGTKEAAATSLVAVALMALPGTYVHWKLGHIDAHMAWLLALGTTPATYLGAKAGIALEPRKSRLLFGCFLLLFGVFFFGRTANHVRLYGWGQVGE